MAEQEALIAVMGPTGCGKTSFINEVSGSSLLVGKNLTSCTAEIAESKSFSVLLKEGTRKVILIDTPGFDDTTKSDLDILKLIANHLTTKYRDSRKLAGVIYMQRISDPRMGGTFTRNARMFRKLCGHKSMVNVVIATTFWSKVTEKEGAGRMQELESDLFFGRAVHHGAEMMAQKGRETALAIIARVLTKGEQALRIQKEIVDHHKNLPGTSASQELYHVLKDQLSKFEEEMNDLSKELKDAQAQGDNEAVQEISEEFKGIENKVKQVATDANTTRTFAANFSSLFRRRRGAT